jgi:DnaJ-class molecular chaperone
MPKSLYQLLEIPSTATPEAIKTAYVKTAARLRSSGAREEYEALKQAYDILSDPATRARYDRQPYLVSDKVPDSASESHWRWRGALIVVAVVGIGSTIWLYNKREQTRHRLEHVRIEAERQAEEDRRAEDQRQRQEQGRLAYERAQDARERSALERSNQSARNDARNDARYRESLERTQAVQRDRLDAQRERDAAQREEMERRRTELEQRQRLQQDKRYADELERASPRRF